MITAELFEYQCRLREELFPQAETNELTEILISVLRRQAHQWDYGHVDVYAEHLKCLLPPVLACDIEEVRSVLSQPKSVRGKRGELIPSEDWWETTLLGSADIIWECEFCPALRGRAEPSYEGWLICTICLTCGGATSSSWQVDHVLAMFLLNAQLHHVPDSMRGQTAGLIQNILAVTPAPLLGLRVQWAVLLERAVGCYLDYESLLKYVLPRRSDSDIEEISTRIPYWISAAEDAEEYWADFQYGIGDCVKDQELREAARLQTLRILRALARELGQTKGDQSNIDR